jgi:hypothetical protein
MPYANNDGVRIYYEVEGKGPPLVLHQALGQVLQLWRTSGYVDALKEVSQAASPTEGEPNVSIR